MIRLLLCSTSRNIPDWLIKVHSASTLKNPLHFNLTSSLQLDRSTSTWPLHFNFFYFKKDCSLSTKDLYSICWIQQNVCNLNQKLTPLYKIVKVTFWNIQYQFCHQTRYSLYDKNHISYILLLLLNRIWYHSIIFWCKHMAPISKSVC